MGERMTWGQIQQKYPDQWIGTGLPERYAVIPKNPLLTVLAHNHFTLQNPEIYTFLPLKHCSSVCPLSDFFPYLFF